MRNSSFFGKIIVICLVAVALAAAARAQSGWNPMRSAANVDLVSVFFKSADKGFVAGDNGFLASTTDGGRTWTPVKLETTDNINEVYFRNDENGFVLAGKRVFRTSDSGASWRETRILNLSGPGSGTPEFLSIRFANKKHGFIVGAVANSREEITDSLVLETIDAGENWSRIKVATRQELYNLDFTGEDHGWIVGDKGVVLSTDDAGATWRAQLSGTDRALFNVDFRNSDEGFAVGAKGTILRTDSGGRIWQKVPVPYTNTLLRVSFYDDKNGFVAGNGGIVLRTDDGGLSWIKQDSKTTENLFGLFMQKKYGYAVGRKGTVLRYLR
jgi:photosystem II stability/assembly factor-like uncharacterized protein